MVWMGAVPSSSVSPPSADKELRALSAPGLVSSWASGMAEASGPAVLLLLVLVPPPSPLPALPRLAFCSSTLRKDKGAGDGTSLGTRKNEGRTQRLDQPTTDGSCCFGRLV